MITKCNNTALYHYSFLSAQLSIIYEVADLGVYGPVVLGWTAKH